MNFKFGASMALIMLSGFCGGIEASEEETAKNDCPVQCLSRPYEIKNGLQGTNIALWASHGWYYDTNEMRWKWQRPRLFESVEDKLPMSLLIDHLMPMLENAGANLFYPRERDTQTNEVVVDNDGSSNKPSIYSETGKGWKTERKGFSFGTGVYRDGQNPFISGSSRQILSSKGETGSATWTPDIPEDGEYAVYVSYKASKNNADDATYKIRHEGGETIFRVNQRQAGSIWLYLGTFSFKKGMNTANGSVRLSNKSRIPGKTISADAVRFGGGMGRIIRGEGTSKRPKYLEAARYYMQYSGMPETVYNFNSSKDDYKDDKLCRQAYANYIQDSLSIPLSLCLALHTDAGISNKFIGTLAIYSSKNENERFPDGKSRNLSMKLADFIQTQITKDLRSDMAPEWRRRELRGVTDKDEAYEGQFSETIMPQTPSCLIELLSHQNFPDMKLALDPKFRFEVSRAIYKGIARFRALETGNPCLIAPLPVKSFASRVHNGKICLSWSPVKDSLEESAKPEGYLVYSRKLNCGWDNGTFCKDSMFSRKIKNSDGILSFRISALNSGGVSLPSEILSLSSNENGTKPALIVNCFTRLDPPFSVNTDSVKGFMPSIDSGVPYRVDHSIVGDQHDFGPKSEFISNDSPGFGASFADMETTGVCGNSFDYPLVHGQAISECGINFVSTSIEGLLSGNYRPEDYCLIDFIFGKQNEKIKDIKKLQDWIETAAQRGCRMFLSGSNLAGEIFDKKFAKEVLRFRAGSRHSSGSGIFYENGEKYRYNKDYSQTIYRVDSPEEILPENGSETGFRFADDSFSASVSYSRKYSVFCTTVPFETISGDKTKFMKTVIKCLEIKK